MQLKTLNQRKRKYFLLILLLFAAGMTKMQAYDFSAVCSTGQTLYYNIINANHSVALTYPGNSTSSPWEGFTKPTGNITLPDSVTYNGVTYPVIQIGNYAFYECSSMTGSLTFPPSVKWIGNYAFYGCNGFTGNLTIPNSVTSIGRYAFNNCNGFTEVQYYANNCSTNGYSYVDYNFNQWIWCPPFIGCTGSLTIGNNIETIPAHMFRGGSFTGNLNIPNSVTSIGTSAFSNCSGFTGSLTIPHSIASIGTVAFSNCSGFTGVIFNATNCVDLSSSSTYTHPSPFYGCGGTLIIGDNVEKIPAYMFDWCSGFTGNLTIPNSVTSIGNYAFSGCSGFTGSLTIPNSVTSIGNSAFSRCSGFTDSLTIGNSVTSIGNSAFSRCSGFTGSLTIGNSVTMIDDYTFYTCNGFTGSLIIPNSVTSIGSNAFAYCSGFTDSLTIGNSVTLIEGRAFDNCSGFTDCLTIGNSVTTIDGYAFYNCSGFTSMNSLAETPPSVGSSTFYLVNHSMPVTVPCGTIGTYQSASGWSQFTNYIEDCSLHITATANPFEGGTVIGAGTFEEGDTCTLVATPNEGYLFENWSNEGNIVSDSTTYSFIVTEDATYVANFTWTNPISVDYVSDGLIMYLDGINNTRNGHSTTTNVWEDLMGNYDLAVTNYNSYSWEGNHFIGHGNGGYLNTGHTWQYFNSLNDDLTIEIVTYIDCDKTSPAYRGLAGWHVNSDGTNFQNDQGGGRMQTLGQLPVSEADDQIATVSYTRNNGSFLNGGWKTNNSNIPSGINSGQTVVFGNSHAQARGWNDSIYCIRMYNRSLTPEEVAYNHSIDIERFGAGFPVIDTTIYAAICHGEDYFENGFEIYYPEVGENQYSITLPSSQGIDSIVNLTLTVHPTYYNVEDTTLCNATSFQWHGNTYTESGIYYDSLQTIHSCDSIYALSLEFFNTPLGEFTYMTPTNNYPFSSLPITFSWDAVSGAEYYNLYLWNVNEPAPSTPFAGNIYNRSCYVPSLQNHQIYNWYVEAVNTCFSTTSSVRNFSLNIPPAMNVSASCLNFGEVALNNSNTLNLYVSGNALDDTITMQISGEDASMFSFEQGSNWNGLTGGLLSVTFSPTAVQYNYTANLVITTGTLTQTVQLTGSLADMFVFNTYVTQDVFEMNSTVPIYGTVMDANNNPASSAEVEVKVTAMNMTRSLFATTGADGHFSVDFVPAYSESGYYTINSGRVGHNSTAVHDDYNIPGMNLVTNDWILWDVVQNETSTGGIVIRNRSQIPLNNIQVTANTLPEGCSFTFQSLSLQGMEEGVLEYSVSGITPTNGYQEVALVATSSEGASMNFTVWYRCAEPRGILYAAPNNIATTMTKGINKIVDVMLYNNGTGPTGNVYLDLPSVDWLSVVGNDTLPSIAVHDSAYFSLRLSANENTSLVQYTGNIAINCERGDGLSLPYSITAVSDSTGTLVVDVTDDYTYNGNGQHLAGATVTVKGYYSLQTVAIGMTGSDGTFTVEDIPEGYYRMSISAPRHAEYQATIQIEGGQTNTQNIYLQYQAITYSWNVVPTEIPDEYSFELIVVFETNVPVPVVTIEMPETFPELQAGESFVFNYIVTNHGLINSYDATLYPPTGHPLYEFTPLITEIDTLRAQETIIIPCTMTRRTSQRSQKVEEALNGSGNRDYYYECPYMARTSIRSYYICRGERIPIYGYRLVNIGSYPCTMAIGIYEPWHEHKPNNNEPHHHEPVPPVTWQQHGCSDDPCQSEALDELNSCPPQNNNTPKLPPFQPGNNR